MKVEHVALGKILRNHREPIEVDPALSYRQVGVRGFGRGFIDYGELPASTLSKLRYFKLGNNRLVVSNIKGWEGAVAVTDNDEHGRIASNRFLQYEPETTVDLNYLRHWLLSDRGIAALGAASPGSADRNRTLSIKNFEQITCPLPTVSDQRRIAAHLDSVEQQTQNAAQQSLNSRQIFSVEQLPRLLTCALETAALPHVRLSALATIRNDTIHPGDDRRGATRFVGLEHIASHLGLRIGDRPLGDEAGRKFRFEPGDVLYGYLRPYQNKAWAADIIGLCSVEQFVLRPRVGVDAALLSAVLRSSLVLDVVNEATNSLQLPRVNLATLMNIGVPDIRMSLVHLSRQAAFLDARFDQILALRDRRTHQVAALLPAARNEVFSAMQ